MTVYNLTCKHCGKAFQAHHPRIAYCTNACQVELKKQAKTRKAQQDKARYEADPQAVIARAAAWKKQNRGRVNAQAREQWADPERKQVMQARIERYTKTHQKQCAKRWKANTRRRIETGQHQALLHKRRAKMVTVLTKREQQKIAQIYRVARLLTKRYGVQYEVDHVIPVARGGKHHPDNLQVLRWDINRAKGAKMPAELAA